MFKKTIHVCKIHLLKFTPSITVKRKTQFIKVTISITKAAVILVKESPLRRTRRVPAVRVLLVLVYQSIFTLFSNQNIPRHNRKPAAVSFSPYFIKFSSCCQNFKHFSHSQNAAFQNVQVFRYRGGEVRSVFSGSLLVT